MRKNLIAFMRKLNQEGYSNSQIALICKVNADQVSRIVNYKSYSLIRASEYINEDFLERQKKVLDTVLLYQEIPGANSLGENDRFYIKLIKKCGGTYDKTRKIYYDRPISELRPAWDYANQFEYEEFDPAILNINEEDFRIFMNC